MMQKTITQNVNPEVQDDKLIVARMIANYFFDVLEKGIESGYKLTEHPENAPLIEALQEIVPEATRNGMYAKMLCIFSEGVNAGIEIASKIMQGKATE